MEDNFGDKLRFWRRKLAFSQNDLAQKSGVSPVTIGQIETGKRKARRHTIQKLIEGLGITDDQFFGVVSHEPPVVQHTPAAAVIEQAPVAMNQPSEKNIPLQLSNLDLEIINRTLNLSFDGKISLLKFLKNLA
jgi:transcriptional regulator with XRE-family HTH domain